MHAEAFPWMMILPMKSKEQQHGTQVLNTTVTIHYSNLYVL